MKRGLIAMRAWMGVAVGFLIELAKSTITVIAAVLGVSGRLRPAIIAVPLDTRSASGITLLANMVTLTPGTTSLDVSEDQRTLYVHALDTADPDAAVQSIKETLEAQVRKVLP
ncbi:MAG: Na+/H+ antiporter subunit E [Hyphomicrobiaceae bacterium]